MTPNFVGGVQIIPTEPSTSSSAASTAEAFSCGFGLTPPLTSSQSPRELNKYFYNKQRSGGGTNTKSNWKAKFFLFFFDII